LLLFFGTLLKAWLHGIMTSVDGGEETREAKRLRQSDGTDSTASTEAPAQLSMEAAIVIALDAAGSTGSSSSRHVTPTANANGPPTTAAVSKQLFLLDLAGSGPTLARDDAVQALETLSNWACDFDDSAFLEHFQRYAGTARVLDFLKQNMGDVNLVDCVCLLLARCLSPDGSTDRKDAASEISRSLVDVRGIETLVLANDQCSEKISESGLEHAMTVWTCLLNVTRLFEDITSNPKEKEQAILLAEAACDWLTKISTTHKVFFTWAFLGKLLGTLAEVFLEIKDMQGRAIVPTALKCLLDVKGSWEHDQLAACNVGEFFGQCSEHSVLTSSQYQDLVPFYINSLKYFPLHSDITSCAVDFLKQASSSVDKSFLRYAGVGVALAHFDISGAPDDEWMQSARELIRKLYRK
jgi:hypothetical protein